MFLPLSSDNKPVTLTLTPPVDTAAAERFARNLDALGFALPFPALDFCLARDGSTTAKRDGHWLAGCSVPRRAAEVMLRKENWPGRSLCLVAPTHGQQIAAVLARLGPTRALIAVVPDAVDLADMLTCCDFAADVHAGRLHVARDEPTLRAIFARHRGLAVPGQMVRLGDADSTFVAAAMPWLQATFSELTIDHGDRLHAAGRVATAGGASAVARCVLVARHFRLGQDTGDTLARALGDDPAAVVFDTDRPTASSAAAAAEAVGTAAVVIADRPRPAWAVADRQWITWLTRPDVPPFNPAHAADALLLADAAWRPLARLAGWPDARLAVAGWPTDSTIATVGHIRGAPPAIVLDVPDLETPADVADVTGRRLVWEAIRDELARDPFAVGADATKYVERAPARLGLPATADFPTARFVERLVAPAFAVGVAKWLAGQDVAVTIHGRGWPADIATAGPVETRDAFHAAVAASGGLIDPSLPGSGDLARSLGVPVVQPFGRTPQRVLQDLAAMHAGRIATTPPTSPLSRVTIDALVR